MNYYIKTKKGINYELSEPLESQELAEEKLLHMHKVNREKSTVIAIPEIRIGLRLFRDGKYYSTILGESESSFYCNRTDERNDDIDDAFSKPTVWKWFIEGILDAVEQYEEVGEN